MFFFLAVPIAPVLAFLNNFIELRVDLYNLMHEQRSTNPMSAHGIGMWNDVLKVFAGIVCASNWAIVSFRTEKILDDFGLEITTSNRYLVFFAGLLSIIVLAFILNNFVLRETTKRFKQHKRRIEEIERALVKPTVEDFVKKAETFVKTWDNSEEQEAQEKNAKTKRRNLHS